MDNIVNYRNSSTGLGVFGQILFIIVGVIAIYYLYKYLFTAQSNESAVILSGIQTAKKDKPVEVGMSSMPHIYEGGEYTVSMWLYINDWNVRKNYNKHILSIGGPSFDTLRIYLGAIQNNLRVRVHTKDQSKNVPTGTKAEPHTDGDSLQKMDKTFNTLQTDSGLLDSNHICDIPQLDMQRWVNVTLVLSGKVADVYVDGKLSRSCVLPSFYKVDSGGYKTTLLAYGGFGGQVSNFTSYGRALGPDDIHKIYMDGPEPVTGLLDYLKQFFEPEKMQ